jgi:hypothetical protein
MKIKNNKESEALMKIRTFVTLQGKVSKELWDIKRDYSHFKARRGEQPMSFTILYEHACSNLGKGNFRDIPKDIRCRLKKLNRGLIKTIEVNSRKNSLMKVGSKKWRKTMCERQQY